jgi:23S rRNA (uracil1939-C5)-methyltransferase
LARKRDLPLLKNLEVIDIADKGKAIARYGDQIVILDHAVPGDIIDAQVVRKRKNYFEAIVKETHLKSNSREVPFCKHFKLCGGCKWQDMQYSQQLVFKQQQVTNQLKRIGHLELPEISEIIPSENTKYYRNKLEYTFSNHRWIEIEEPKIERTEHELYALGFHIPGRFDKILKIDTCWLQPEPSNEIRNFIAKRAIKLGLSFYDLRQHSGYLRNLIIRTTQNGETMVILSIANSLNSLCELLLDDLYSQFNITSLMYMVNTKLNDSYDDLNINLYKGRDYIIELLHEMKFKIGPKSFFQTNTKQAEKLYSIAKQFASPKSDEIIYDLYTGTGTIANYIAPHCKKVIGIEYIPEAITDAQENASLNHIKNTVFFAGDIKDLLTESFFATHGKPDTIILDPPRAGIHEKVAQSILYASPTTIVYISCNAATQARDLAIFKDNYTITHVQAVDMFPHTQHVENVVKLVHK